MSRLDQDPEAVASELGCEVVTAGPYDVFVDIDDRNDLKHMDRVLNLFEKHGFSLEFAKETVSKSGNVHVYLRASRALTDIERVAIQACLGSDRLREAFSVLRIVNQTKAPPTVFFEKRVGIKRALDLGE